MNHTVSKKVSFLFVLSLMNSTHTNQQIILWDIHDVLLTRSGVISTLWNYGNWWNLITHTSLGLIKDLIVQGIKNLFTPMSSEQYIELARKHSNPYLEQLIIQLTNSQKPMPGMNKIVQALHDAGYEQHVASNIGKTAFLALTNPGKYPELASQFEYMDIEKSYVVSEEQGIFLKKPDPLFFKAYLQNNDIDPQKTPVIFIDNNKTNIKSAQNAGMKTVLFENPEQLIKALKKLGIHLSPMPLHIQ